jgi:ABC-2 type transport system permease protein
MIILSSGISVLAMFIGTDRTPVGYVDHSGVLASPVLPEPDGLFGESMEFIAYTDPAVARQALLDGAIQGYFVIAENYQQSGMVEYFTPDLSYDMVIGDFEDLMRHNLLQAYPETVRTRFEQGSNITVRALESTQQLNLDQWWNLVLPLVIAFLLFILIQVGGSYILQAMVTEKENRMMEILITAVTPTELMVGKTIGNLGVALTMLLVWGLCGGAVLLFLPAYALTQVSINWGVQVIAIVLFLETLIMMACLMLMAGVMATDAREAGQLTWFFGLVMSLPFIVITSVIFDPDGPMSTIMSMFPFTAFFVMPVRMTFTQVPGWQVALSIVLLAGMIALAVWLATRAMKQGMLSFSRKIKYSNLLKQRRAA